ncbi:HlyD family efflux transporter periplasmic adaptor subunit [uncultured Subdoligranulum sp.]|uniref:HlyD family efflux transporter periplasmic adaptor subunit n=1 Tax=uncultured Subdoligranulum sp. TaxID=512298 RepID=UPI0026113617|nr:HlyD family efflux transporter periplasmic adaptor subunit [uncultured Subdoligranulum sp.]
MEPNKRQIRAAQVIRWIGIALLAVVSLYVVIQCFVIFRQSYKTETAIQYTMADSVTLDGVVSFASVPVEGTGDLGYLVQDGERVSNGTVLAECYTDDSQGLLRERLDRLGRTIDLLSKSQNSTGSDLSVLTNQTRQALYNLLDKLDTAEYSGINDAEDDFLLAQNRLQINTGQTGDFTQTISTLQAEYDEINAELSSLQTITATTNGYFSSTEAAPTIATDQQALDDASPLELQQMLSDGFPAADTNRAGQIATGFSWRFYTVCDLETAARFDGITSVKISVPGKQNTPLTATLVELTQSEEDGIAKLVFECQSINAEILSFGQETAQIDIKTYEGIRIDKEALHIVDGSRGVYVKYGNLQRFLKITILYEDENYILIPDDGAVGTDNEVRLYDEIIVQGTNLQDGKLL